MAVAIQSLPVQLFPRNDLKKVCDPELVTFWEQCPHCGSSLSQLTNISDPLLTPKKLA